VKYFKDHIESMISAKFSTARGNGTPRNIRICHKKSAPTIHCM